MSASRRPPLDLAGARVYAIPLTERFRGITVREGMLVEGPAGWGEFCPFDDYDAQVAASWLAPTVEAAPTSCPRPDPRQRHGPGRRA